MPREADSLGLDVNLVLSPRLVQNLADESLAQAVLLAVLLQVFYALLHTIFPGKVSWKKRKMAGNYKLWSGINFLKYKRRQKYVLPPEFTEMVLSLIHI